LIALRRQSRPVRVLLVEDNDVYAETLQLLLGSLERIEVVGRARNGVEGVELALGLEPHAILMDVSMPLLNGFDATRRITARLPGTRIVMLTSSDDPADRARARACGAVGYLTKDRGLDDLVAAVTAAPERPYRAEWHSLPAVAHT
jgi:DNA-binding NarL/FixJ family response regulator